MPSRRIAVAIAAIVLVLAACQRQRRRSGRRGHARQDQGGRQDPRRHRCQLQAAVVPQGGRHLRGLRRRRRQGGRQAPRRGGRVPVSRLERRRWRQLGRPLRHQRRLDDHHRAAARGLRLHPALLLHARPRWRSSPTPASPTWPVWRARSSAPARRRPTGSGCRATLALGDGSELAPVPEGATATTLKTDQDCAQSAQSGRRDFDGWLSSSTTVKAAIDAGAPMVTVGIAGLLRAARHRHRQGQPAARGACSPRSTGSSARCMPMAPSPRCPTSGSMAWT